MLGHALDAARGVDPASLLGVVGHAHDLVSAEVCRHDPAARPVVQQPQNGTGHAVRLALEEVPDMAGTVIVIPGDAPLLTADTLRTLVEQHQTAGNAATLLTASRPDATGYCRDVVSSVAALPAVWCCSTRVRNVSAVSSGASPGITMTVPARSGTSSRASRTAWPVPFCGCCTTVRAAGSCRQTSALTRS